MTLTFSVDHFSDGIDCQRLSKLVSAGAHTGWYPQRLIHPGLECEVLRRGGSFTRVGGPEVKRCDETLESYSFCLLFSDHGNLARRKAACC